MLHIDYRDSRPIYEQIADGFSRLVLCGALAPEEQMPSVRQLAIELAVNPNTIQKAYSELERRGVIYVVKGRGNFVRENGNMLRMQRLEVLQAQVAACIEEARELGADDTVLATWLAHKQGEGEHTK